MSTLDKDSVLYTQVYFYIQEWKQKDGGGERRKVRQKDKLKIYYKGFDWKMAWKLLNVSNLVK